MDYKQHVICKETYGINKWELTRGERYRVLHTSVEGLYLVTCDRGYNWYFKSKLFE